MNVSRPFTCRRVRWARPWAMALVIAMALMTNGAPQFLTTVVNAQQQTAPINQGFHLDSGDLRFIFKQIQVAQAHAAGGTLLGPGPNQVNAQAAPNGDPQLPMGLRTVDGTFNNLVPGQEQFGAADLLFPRMLTPFFRNAEPLPFDPDGPGPQAAGQPTSYTQKSGFVSDSQPRIISNLIVDQKPSNPAAVAAAANPCGQGGFVCQNPAPPDPTTGALFIPNITPDFGLSAPFNLMFAFFGQFFDHGLDLVTKGGGTVIMPLQPDDPLFVPGSATNFMAMTRGQNQPGPDGILGTADDIQEGQNTTTPWVDQNQTYTSHPSHQVFLRMYALNAQGKPAQTGKMLDGDHCVPRPTGIAGDNICNIGNWADVKRQAATMLGIHLVDQDVFNVPLIVTDPYGHFKPGPNGFPQMVRPGNILVEGNPAGGGVLIPADALRTGHAFLNDIAHTAEPDPGLVPDADTTVGSNLTPQPPGTYDDELLNLHFVTGDGRGNENIALSAIHQIFHAEHNRLVANIDQIINLPVNPATGVNATGLTQAEINGWHATDPASGWDYAERLFQAARFGTEMQYQHLVFEEFARTMQPLINPFLGGITSINAAIKAEFAHTVYRLGHSMLPEVVTRINPDGSVNDIRLFNAFLNPVAYNNGGAFGTLNAAQAVGSIVRGLSRTVGNELDEFVTDSVRNTLTGLPLDLAAINIARGRSEGIPSLNNARKQLFAATQDASLKPYANWFEFGQAIRHHESLTNFVAAYGTDPTITGATTLAAKRAAAGALVAANGPFMFADSTTSGLDNVDFWVGGLAERPPTFGGKLGVTFNWVFEHQLEDLQNGDRFYYLQRTDGLAFRFQLEGNSFAELIRRNSDFAGGMGVIFDTADFIFDPTTPNGPLDPTDPNSAQIITQPGPDGVLGTADDTKTFFDPLHRGKNIEFDGGPGNDRFIADVGDDTLYGNDGNDRLDGGEGNDNINGGNGDDILFGGNGNDVLKGGPGNDALSSGPGFGGDIEIGGDGNDFMLGGDDGVEYFGGPGDDIVVDGAQRAEAILGGPGDDWIYDGDGHDGGIFGDNGNIFDLLAGLDPIGGDDVEGGGPGQDNHFGEGGNDIFVMSEGSNKFFGDYGWDWITLRDWPLPEFVELDLLAQPGVVLNFNDLRNRYRYVDGASGWDLDDHIAGSNNVLCTPPGEIAECLIVGMELTAGTPPVTEPAVGVPGQVNFRGGSGAAKIAGLTQLMGPAGFNKNLNDPAIPLVKGVGFMGGDILLGGKGSDVLQGKAGDDLIDGDLWLNVQLRAVMNDGTIKLVDDPRLLVDDVFADPQRLNPGNISIIRTIVTPTDTPPPDCGTAAPRNCDTAVFINPLAEYSIVLNPNGSVTVSDSGPPLGNPNLSDGTDTLRNIEQLQFADVTIPVPKPLHTVPGVVGLTQAAASAAITGAGLTVGTVTSANSTTIAIGLVATSSPLAGTSLPAGAPVNLVISLGTAVPTVTGTLLGDGNTPGTAIDLILEAGLVAGTITQQSSTTVPAGVVISQNPAAATNVNPGTAVNLVVSSGPPNVIVPNVVGLTQAQASTNLTGANLKVGTITSVASTTVPAGNVISQNPAAGASAPVGSAVALTVSLGNAPTITTITTKNNSTPNTTNTSSVFAVNANTVLLAFISTDAPSTGANTVVNRIDTPVGGALTWTRAARANVQLGTAEVWWALVPNNRPQMQITAVLNNSETSSVTVVGVTGGANTLVGAASIIANGALNSGTFPNATLTTTRANSWVFGVGVDWDNAHVMVPGTGQTMVSQFQTPNGDSYWVSRTTNAVAVAGTPTTINVTYPGATHNDRWNLALIEIRQP